MSVNSARELLFINTWGVEEFSVKEVWIGGLLTPAGLAWIDGSSADSTLALPWETGASRKTRASFPTRFVPFVLLGLLGLLVLPW